MHRLKTLAHVAWGIATALTTRLSPFLALIMAISFISYEVVEKWSKGDRGYPEIRQFMYGIGIGLAIMLVIRYVLAP